MKLDRSQLLADIKEAFPEIKKDINAEYGLLHLEVNVLHLFAQQMINDGENEKLAKYFAIAEKYYICPVGESLWLKNEGIDKRGNYKLFFEGRLSKCRDCSLKVKCMSNPDSANTGKGHGRQVFFVLDNKRVPNFTEWMK